MHCGAFKSASTLEEYVEAALTGVVHINTIHRKNGPQCRVRNLGLETDPTNVFVLRSRHQVSGPHLNPFARNGAFGSIGRFVCLETLRQC